MVDKMVDGMGPSHQENGGNTYGKITREQVRGACYLSGSNRSFDFWLQWVGHQQKMTPHILRYSYLQNSVRPAPVMQALTTCSPSYPPKLRQECCLNWASRPDWATEQDPVSREATRTKPKPLCQTQPQLPRISLPQDDGWIRKGQKGSG